MLILRKVKTSWVVLFFFVLNNRKNVFLFRGVGREKYLDHQLLNTDFLKKSGKIQN